MRPPGFSQHSLTRLLMCVSDQISTGTGILVQMALKRCFSEMTQVYVGLTEPLTL